MPLIFGGLYALVSGALFALATMLEPSWWAAWLAPIPLLIAAFRSSLWQSWLFAAIAALIGLTGKMSYDLMFVGAVGEVVVAVILVIATGLAVTLTRAMVRRGRASLAIFFYPAMMAGLGAIAAAASPHGTSGSLAYSQVTFLPVVQIASVAGAPGIVFVVALFASLIAVAIDRRAASPHYPLIYGAPAIIVIAALAFGIWRLDTGMDAAAVPVGLAVSDKAPPPRAPIDPADTVWKTYTETVPALASQGARFIVWPEKIARLDAPAAERVKKLLGDAARDNKIHLVVGLTLLRGDKVENRAWLFAPSGDLIADYSKQHLVPGFETPAFTPGHEDAVRAIGGDKIGVAICKDMDFEQLGRGYSNAGVAAMLVPALDFDSDAWAHASLAVLRGVEGGFTVVRSARQGLLTVSDRYGRVVDRRASAGGTMVTMETTAPVGPGGPTIYARFGYLFGWLCAAFALVAALSLLVARPRSAAGEN